MSQKEQARLPGGPSGSQLWMSSMGTSREARPHHRGDGLYAAFMSPLIKLWQQKHILFAKVIQGQFPFYSITHLDQKPGQNPSLKI